MLAPSVGFMRCHRVFSREKARLRKWQPVAGRAPPLVSVARNSSGSASSPARTCGDTVAVSTSGRLAPVIAMSPRTRARLTISGPFRAVNLKVLASVRGVVRSKPLVKVNAAVFSSPRARLKGAGGTIPAPSPCVAVTVVGPSVLLCTMKFGSPQADKEPLLPQHNRVLGTDCRRQLTR